MLRRNKTVLTMLSAAVLTAFAACGGDDGPAGLDIVYNEDNPAEDVLPSDDLTETAIRDEGSDKGDSAEIHLYEIFLLHDTSAPIPVRANTQFAIVAKVIDYGQNQVAGGLMLKAEITSINDAVNNNPATGDGTVQTAMVQTGDSDGIGKIGFNAGSVEGVTYEITVSLADYPAVASKTIKLQVFDIPCGCLKTTLAYEGVVSYLKDIEVYILPSEYRCNTLAPTRPIPEEALIASRTASNMYSGITFDCLPGEKRYTVYVRAGGTQSTCVAATGCYEGMYIEPEQCQDLEVELYTTLLNPAGAYDSIDHFDFRNMVQECAGGQTSIMNCVTGASDVGRTVCCAIQEMIKFFETPGTTIMEGIRDIVKIWVGSIIVDTVYNLIGDIIADWITGWLTSSSPEWLQNFFTIGDDMMGTITNLELVSDLLIKKLNNDFTVQGTHYWYGMNLYWKFGCDPAAPDYDQCGKIELHMDDYIDDPAFPMNFLEGRFNASVDFDKLWLNQHEIKLNYGKLVLYVINEIVIAGLTGGQAHSMLELVFMWIDCKSFAEGTFGDIVEAIGVGTKADLEQACRTTITGLFGFVESFLNALALDTTLSLTGDARLVDEDCDLMVDQIVNGVYRGYIQGDTSQALVTGDFTATRK